MPRKKPNLREWPADEVTRAPIASIQPYPRNPRTHSDAQIGLLAQSIEQFGFTAPLLVDEDGIVIYGHGRLLAAQMLGLEEVPVAVARGWTDAEKSAYRIMDNQLGLLSDWDTPMLKAELHDLSIDGSVELKSLGFPELQLDKLVPSLSLGAPQRELSDAQKPLMVGAWQALAAEWFAILNSEQFSTNFTRGALAVHFLRSRFFGTDIPSAATLAYNPHRARTKGDDFSLVEGLEKASHNEDGAAERLMFVTGGVPRLDKILSGTLPFLGARMPADFPSALARELYDEFCPDDAAVLDPCHGWGGRMLGFLLSDKTRLYCGFDPDVQTSKGVHDMFNDLAPYANGKKRIRLESTPFEDVKLPEAHFDFALTSPPYFDTEKYGGEESSWRRYPTLEEWIDGFYRPLIEKTAAALKPGAVFALQIGNQRHDLGKLAVEIGGGLTHVETRATAMSAKPYIGLHSDGEERDPLEHEVIVILKKKAAQPKPRRSVPPPTISD